MRKTPVSHCPLHSQFDILFSSLSTGSSPSGDHLSLWSFHEDFPSKSIDSSKSLSVGHGIGSHHSPRATCAWTLFFTTPVFSPLCHGPLLFRNPGSAQPIRAGTHSQNVLVLVLGLLSLVLVLNMPTRPSAGASPALPVYLLWWQPTSHCHTFIRLHWHSFCGDPRFLHHIPFHSGIIAGPW